MGVEKGGNDAGSSRLNKNSVDIYRPPALRKIDAALNEKNEKFAQKRNETKSNSELINNQDQIINEEIGNKVQSNINVTVNRPVRKERRPDRAVYIPRARRSQIITSSQVNDTTIINNTTESTSHISPTSSTYSSLASNHTDNKPNIKNSNNISSSVAATKRNSNKSSLSSSSALLSLSLQSSTSQLSVPNNITSNLTTTNTAPITYTTTFTTIGDSHNINSIVKESPKRSFNQNCMIFSDINNCDNYKNPPPINNITTISNHHPHHYNYHHNITDDSISTQELNISSISTESNNDLLSNSSLVLNNTNNTFDINCDKIYKNNSQDYLNNSCSNIDTVDSVQSNNFLNNMFTNVAETNKIQNVLRIEDAIIVDRKSIDKEDNKEIEELQRASKEINRSNRCIIKQTFNSDILEIPEPDEIIMKKPKSENVNKGGEQITNNDRKSKEIDPENDDWDSMFDDNGECIDPKIISELTASVGKVKIETPKNDYKAYHIKQSILNDEEFPHVLEISNFPVEFKTQDLMMIFSTYKESGFDIKWVDDTHALAVFSSSRIAAEVLSKGHPFVLLKPLAEATVESRAKAKKCSASLQPYRPRPETCAALARRLVTGALGVRLKTAAQERENEKRVLKEAKERKLLAAKQRDEAWES